MRKNLKIVALFVGLSSFGVAACGEDVVDKDPEILNVTVDPKTWKVSGFVDSAQFKISADVLHFDAAITSVVASVRGQPNLSYNLTKESSIANGERWSVATTVTLWKSISAGTYTIDVTATDAEGKTATKQAAETVTVTD